MVIIDKRMPLKAKKKLANYGELIELETTGITYSAISGHPDIFFCQTPGGLIASPNLPEKYYRQLQQNNIQLIQGIKPVGAAYPETSHYNAMVTSEYLVHNLSFTDPVLINACRELKTIKVKQAYTRCNLLALENNTFLTSDPGIHKTLSEADLQSHYFDPQKIQLRGFAMGFLGGACGTWKHKLFLCGSLRHHQWSKQFRTIAENAGYEICELYDEPLTDVGSILFVG